MTVQDVLAEPILVAVVAFVIIVVIGERWIRPRRRPSQRPHWSRRAASSTAAVPARPVPIVQDASAQLRHVMAAAFTKQRLMSPSEARVFKAAEATVTRLRLGWRVMAQVNLGEILSTSDRQAHAAINSKRVDMLLISRSGEPMAAIEYQGNGHHQGTAAARDAVKKEALRRAGIGYIEIFEDHDLEQILALEIGRVSKAAEVPQSA